MDHNEGPPIGCLMIAGVAICAIIVMAVLASTLPSGEEIHYSDLTDEEVEALKADTDGDGYCEHISTCESENLKPGDCDDANPTIHPGVIEGPSENQPSFADGIDNDCDGEVDEQAIDVDNDGDGYCEYELRCQGDAKPNDCDDTDSDIHPGAREQWTIGAQSMGYGTDNDCDGIIDNGTMVVDDDGDGFCEESCSDGTKPGDCDDARADIHPDAAEGEKIGEALFGDGLDNDCDGEVDEDTVKPEHFDNDDDGYCESEPCFGDLSPNDCDDQNPLIHPGAAEGQPDEDGVIHGDNVDNDCDGVVDEGTINGDADQDGMSAADGDCNDQNPLVFAGAPEWRDSTDNNCDGRIDASDELRPLTELPKLNKGLIDGNTYHVYTPDAFEARGAAWRYDHDQPIASINWVTGELTLINRPDADVFEKDAWKIEEVKPPFMTITHKVPGEEDRWDSHTDLLRFDERERPLRVSLVMDDVPRPGIRVFTDWPIDGLIANTPDTYEVHLTGSPAGIPALRLVDGQAERTAISFYRCTDEACQGDAHLGAYLGHIELAQLTPKEVWASESIEVEIAQITKIDLGACRYAYEHAQRNLGHRAVNLEQYFRPVEAACLTAGEEVTFPFRLIFRR